MQKTLLITVMVGMGMASAARAVVISWSAETSGMDYNSARLVYIADGVWDWYTYTVVDTVSDSFSLPGGGVTPQNADDSDRRGDPAGAYFVALFRDDGGIWYRSMASLEVNNDTWNALTFDIMNPASGTYTPTGGVGDGWEVIPEPGTFALLTVGTAVLAWRRRRRRA